MDKQVWKPSTEELEEMWFELDYCDGVSFMTKVQLYYYRKSELWLISGCSYDEWVLLRPRTREDVEKMIELLTL